MYWCPRNLREKGHAMCEAQGPEMSSRRYILNLAVESMKLVGDQGRGGHLTCSVGQCSPNLKGT
jgi:hypothetical protein